MTTLTLDRPIVKTLSLNTVLGFAIVALPALSHMAALPLYRFEPMRLLLFAAILFSGRRNALLAAVWMPLLAFWTSGHPVFPKVVLIQGELLLNGLIFLAVFRRSGAFAPAAVLSILASKAAYYAAKFVLIQAALLDGKLVATPWTIQLAVVIGISMVGWMVCSLRNSARS